MHETVTFEDQEVTSKEIERLQKKIDDLNASIATTREQRTEEEKILEQLDAEFGGEIARIRKEFARMKERSIEEAVEISNKAKSDALKEVLPITDNYYRAKTLFEPLVTEGDKTVMAAYDNIFAEFMKVIEGTWVCSMLLWWLLWVCLLLCCSFCFVSLLLRRADTVCVCVCAYVYVYVREDRQFEFTLLFCTCATLH